MNSNNYWECFPCNKLFASEARLHEHYLQNLVHHYCGICKKHFSNARGLLQHSRAVHFVCDYHQQTFRTAVNLKEHYVQSGDHFYCQYCDIHEGDVEGFFDHGEACHPDTVCYSCVKIFPDIRAFINHKECDHYYCRECDSLFSSHANLTAHLQSSIHQPVKFTCPGSNCRRGFVSLSGLISHAESGSCPSGITRQMVNNYVARTDRNNVITNPNRLITGPGGSISAPSSDQYFASSASWNGCGYECFLCHKDFLLLDSLNKHLQSLRHQQKIYRCPNSNCRVEYSALSSLCQHVERDTCGVQRFRQVQSVMSSLENGMRMLTV